MDDSSAVHEMANPERGSVSELCQAECSAAWVHTVAWPPARNASGQESPSEWGGAGWGRTARDHGRRLGRGERAGVGLARILPARAVADRQLVLGQAEHRLPVLLERHV